MTPGFGALSHARRPTRRLMSALLPTFGKPMTQARTALGFRPRAERRALISLLACEAAFATWMHA